MTDFPDNASTGGDILVVDDLPDNLKLLGEILKSSGHRFRPMTSGPMALRSVAKQPPELILLDIRMPEMDGFEVCRQLKANERSRDIPVIFISAKGDVPDKVKAFELGGVDYISKPFEAEEVLARVDTHLALSRLRFQLEERVAERTRELEETFASLKESEEKYRTLYNTMAQGVVYQDESGKIISANNAAQEILGLSLDQMQGKTSVDPHWKTIHENGEDFPGETHPAMEALRTGKVVSNIVMGVYHPEDQRHRWIIINATPQFREGEDKPYQVYTTFADFTERKRAEEKLRASEERFRTISEVSTVAIYMTDADGKCLYANPLWLTHAGMSLADALGNGWSNGLHPDDREAIFSSWEEMTRSKGQWGLEYRFMTSEGKITWVLGTANTIEDDTGNIIGYVGVNIDITERKQAEDALRESEAGLAEAQRMAHIGNWELDLVTNQLGWSEEIYRIFEIDSRKFGASYEAFLGAIHPDDRERVNTAYTESVKNKMPYSLDHRLCMPDGTIKHVQEYCETFFDNEGNPIRSVGTVQDITEQYLTEQSLKKLNQSLRALSACNEVLVRAEDETELLDKVCRIIVDISEYRLAWVGLVEHDEAKTIRPVSEAGYDDGYLNTVKLTWADTERGRGPGGTAIRTGKPCVIRDVQSDSRFAPWRQQAIEHGYASVVGLPLIDGKKPFGVLLVYASEVNSFDDEELRLLQKLADDLAFGIMTLRSHQERHELNRQLQQAQKMEAIGQLTGGIAHDFNNILASILGFTSLALQRFVRDDQPELQDYLSEVLHAGERARDLVSQMLAFSRTGSSNVHQLQLAPMVKEVTKMLKATLPSSIQLSSQIDADVPTVMMDPVQLQQVLMNMCINARDAIGDKGRIDIRVRRMHIVKHDLHDSQTDASSVVLRDICDACHHDIEEGDYTELSVRDSGSGISDETLKRIFEPFFTTKDVNKGTGMGLSMVHGIIHQHEGHILVDTEIGIGTTFRLLFPVGKPVSNHRPDIGLETSPITEGLNGARILIVDDEESIARFMGDLFENRGGKPTIMVDSQAALDLFSQDPTAFDLVITDQTMPGLTGAELAQEMLALRPELPVILCTGYSEQVDEAKAKALGIRGYLTKPMDVKTLFNLVQSLIV